MNCTRCGGTGFLNLEQIDKDVLATFESTGDHQIILNWIDRRPLQQDVSVCDCCGDSKNWYGIPGEHHPKNREYLPECY
jgi:hypothetical protein